MNLYEFKEALESDATKENKDLKKQIEQLTAEKESLIIKIKNLEKDGLALTNRCWVIIGHPSHGALCYNCSLREIKCEHAISEMEILQKELRELSKKEDGGY